MSEYTESNTTNELLDYLGQDCEWAAECVRSRYNSLKRERAEVEAELAELREEMTTRREHAVKQIEANDRLIIKLAELREALEKITRTFGSSAAVDIAKAALLQEPKP